MSKTSRLDRPATPHDRGLSSPNRGGLGGNGGYPNYPLDALLNETRYEYDGESRVAKAPLRDLIDRGLSQKQARLFVIDGSKAIRAAIRKIFGHLGVVQRCQLHKQRNVLGHLPEHLHVSVKAALAEAWAMNDAPVAQRRLERLASSLEADHPGAAGSVREGLDETLTLQRLGVAGALYRKLRSTNAIENLNSGIAISEITVSRYTPKRPSPTGSRQRWTTFMHNHLHETLAIDFAVVPTVTFGIAYVFYVLSLERRRVLHFNVTRHPTARWTAQQVVEACAFDLPGRFLIRDSDKIYGAYFQDRVLCQNSAHRYAALR